MRLCAVAIVRNEADIVEAFVRHNLTVVDRLVVVDHGSFDGTSEILAALVREGLPLTVAADERVGFFQPEVLTPLARDLLRHDSADFVFMLDADEFLKTPSRRVLERTLARAPQGMHALVPWVTYIPEFEGAAGAEDPLAPLRSAKRLPVERKPQHKVAVARSFLETPAAFVAMGNHRVLPSDETPDAPCPHARLPQEAAAVAHVPVRSAAQLTAKIAIGWLAYLSSGRNNPALSFHWGEAYAKLAAGRRFSPSDLVAMAANYSVPESEWVASDRATWVDEPFLADIGLRYSKAGPVDDFAAVLRFAERMARAGYQLSAGTGTAAP